MKLPASSIGYSVNPDTGTLHTRYPGDHAGPVRKARTQAAIDAYLDGRKPKVCKTCWPPKSSRASTNGTTDAPTLHPVRHTHTPNPLPALPEPTEQG